MKGGSFRFERVEVIRRTEELKLKFEGGSLSVVTRAANGGRSGFLLLLLSGSLLL